MTTHDSSFDQVAELRNLLDRWCTQQPAGTSLALDGCRVELLEALLGPAACRRLGIYRLPDGFLLSVVIPVYNEAATVEAVIDRVRHCGVPCEIIIVDDASTDGTRELIDRHQGEPDLIALRHEINRGKGAALKTGFARARGDVVAVQDADLEYDPADFAWLLQSIVEGEADVVYGSRFKGDSRRVRRFWHYTANRFLTFVSNVFTGLHLSDVETCYKLFRREIIQQILPSLVEERFGIEPEITARLARIKDIRIVERPITYVGRSYAEGKKIAWRDALRAMWCIVRY